MSKNDLKAWTEIAKLLGNDPKAKVKCPSCGNDFVKVEDHDSPLDSMMFERILLCPACGKRGVIRMKKKED